MYITYGGIGLWHNMLDYICQSLFEMASYWPTITTAATVSEAKGWQPIVRKTPRGRS